jgi:RimJ/RimL family protein N-acetyltransferase
VFDEQDYFLIFIIMNNNVSIRYASKDDCEVLSKVIKLVIENIPYYNDIAKKDEVEKFTKETLTEKIAGDAHSVIIAHFNIEVAGFCLSRFDDYTIWLEWFGIHEKYRGKGLTSPILKKLEETVGLRKSHKIWCDCRTSNSASIHILTSHGYKQLVTINNHWYNQDFILWEKLIR